MSRIIAKLEENGELRERILFKGQTYVHISLTVHILNALVLIKREEFLQKNTRGVKETPRRILNW